MVIVAAVAAVTVGIKPNGSESSTMESARKSRLFFYYADMLISIIIPHWNGKKHLPDCLSSLQNQTWDEHEVLLVDNGSTDGTQAYVKTNYPAVSLIELGENRGFTGACLAGYARTQGEIIILLNNDTEVGADWLAEIMAAFERNPKAGAVASRMMLFDERDRFHTAGDFLRENGVAGNRGVWERDEGQYDAELVVFSACGGAAAYRREMLDEIGFLDPDYFFSHEDVDLGWRALLAGWQTVYAPKAVVYHKLKASGGGVTASFYDARNRIWTILKNYPAGVLRRNWRVIVAGQWAIAREALTHWRGEAARATLRGQILGILGGGRALAKRRQIQNLKRVSDAEFSAYLWPVDDV